MITIKCNGIDFRFKGFEGSVKAEKGYKGGSVSFYENGKISFYVAADSFQLGDINGTDTGCNDLSDKSGQIVYTNISEMWCKNLLEDIPVVTLFRLACYKICKELDLLSHEEVAKRNKFLRQVMVDMDKEIKKIEGYDEQK